MKPRAINQFDLATSLSSNEKFVLIPFYVDVIVEFLSSLGKDHLGQTSVFKTGIHRIFTLTPFL